MQLFFGNAKACYDDTLLQNKNQGGASMFKVFAEGPSAKQVQTETNRLKGLGIENVPTKSIRNVLGNRNRRNAGRNPRV